MPKPTRLCDIEGCGKKHRARGLCQMHYKRAGLSPRTMYPRACRVCAVDYLAVRKDGQFCSDTCKGEHYRATLRTISDLPRDHPVMLAIAAAKRAEAEERARQAAARRRSRFEWRTERQCPGCACWFTPIYTSSMMVCSTRCSRKVSRRRRRAREAGAFGSWTWSEFMRVARKFDYCCAYCGTNPGQLDPDHVVPISRGGYDSTTNLLPSCRQCNGDKRDLMLEEWALDRERRGKAPRVTSWAREDKRYWHLTQITTELAA